MILNSRNNLFVFNFPKAFMPDEIAERYRPYLNRIPGNMITRPIDFLNYSIQSVNLPGPSYSPVDQVGKHGSTRNHRDSKPLQELYSKEMTITFQLLDGYINYWMMMDIFNYWYSFPNTPDNTFVKDPYLPVGMNVRILDSEGNGLVTTEMKRVLYTELSSLEMSFSENTPDFTTFDASFVYNELITKIELK